MYVICLPRKNRSYFWAHCSSINFFVHMLVEKLTMQWQSSHQANRSQGNLIVHNRSWCHKFVCWLSYLNSLIHCIVTRERTIRSHTSVVNFTSNFEILYSQEGNFPRFHSEKELSDNPSYHRENLFHQYDPTFHLQVLNLQMKDAKFFQLLKIVVDRPSWACGRSKTVPIIPVQFYVFWRNW